MFFGTARWQMLTYTISSSWQCPVGVTSIGLVVLGGGGGGGGTRSNSGDGAGGGGGGGIDYRDSYAVVPGQTYTIVIGAGGASVVEERGLTGGSTTFSSISGTITGAGGGGGGGGGNGGDTRQLGGDGATGGGGNGYDRTDGFGGNQTLGTRGGSGGRVGRGGGGGGYGGRGGDGVNDQPGTPNQGGAGGSGFNVVLLGPNYLLNIGGGGGGGAQGAGGTLGALGSGGGGGGGAGPGGTGVSGTINTGGGGGGSAGSVAPQVGAQGGSGAVIIILKDTLPIGTPVSFSGSVSGVSSTPGLASVMFQVFDGGAVRGSSPTDTSTVVTTSLLSAPPYTPWYSPQTVKIGRRFFVKATGAANILNIYSSPLDTWLNINSYAPVWRLDIDTVAGAGNTAAPPYTLTVQIAEFDNGPVLSTSVITMNVQAAGILDPSPPPPPPDLSTGS